MMVNIRVKVDKSKKYDKMKNVGWNMGEQNKKYLIFDLDEVILDVMKEFDGNKEKLPNEEMAKVIERIADKYNIKYEDAEHILRNKVQELIETGKATLTSSIDDGDDIIENFKSRGR